MTEKQFQRNKEDFVCEHCGHKVQGTGYTNHCPKCLYSKHVDVNPGDRGHICQGLMEPIGIETTGGETVIIHKCIQCRTVKRNKTSPEDSTEEVIRVSTL